MSGCLTCGGYGMKHDPIAHDEQRADGEAPDLSVVAPTEREDEGMAPSKATVMSVPPEAGDDGWPLRDCDHDGGECHDIAHGTAPRKVIVLHMVYPDGTHTGDCEGCLWAQSETVR